MSKIYPYLKKIAEERDYIILEGSSRRIFQFADNEQGQKEWVQVDCLDPDKFIFDSYTLYGISAAPILIYP